MRHSLCAGVLRTKRPKDPNPYMLQNQEGTAWAPGIWPHEMLNGLGKGVTRGRVEREKAFLFWQEMMELPVRVVHIPVDENLRELALKPQSCTV